VRRISHLFELILVLPSFRMFTHNEIIDCNRPVRMTNPFHLPESMFWRFEMMKR
jgi:hypothetical protein